MLKPIKLWLATHNRHKLHEMKVLLERENLPLELELADLQEISDYPSPQEDGESFLANARLKAKALRSFGKPVREEDWILAEDSGLEVLRLQGRPGIRSARYAGEQAGDTENNKKLLKELKGLEEGKTVKAVKTTDKNKACFVCQMVLMTGIAQEAQAQA